jgi:hypothetical protein
MYELLDQMQKTSLQWSFIWNTALAAAENLVFKRPHTQEANNAVSSPLCLALHGSSTNCIASNMSVANTAWHRTLWLLNNELEIIQKEVSVA